MSSNSILQSDVGDELPETEKSTKLKQTLSSFVPLTGTIDQAKDYTKRKWLDEVPNQNVRSHFQNFVNSLTDFSAQFRKEKYAQDFFMMADPTDQLLTLLLQGTPPEDVLVATLSGSLKTNLNLLAKKKSGKSRNSVFLQMSERVNGHLQTFVGDLQDAIRCFHDVPLMTKKAKEVNPRSSMLGGFNRSKTYEEPTESLRQRIQQLRAPPISPTTLSNLRGAMFNSPFIMISGIVIIGLAFGMFVCTEWYQVERKIWAWVVPFCTLGFGLALVVCGYFMNHSRKPAYTAESWTAKFRIDPIPGSG